MPLFVNYKNLDEVEEAIKTLKFYGFQCWHSVPYTVKVLCPTDKWSKLAEITDDLKEIFAEGVQ